MRKIAIGLLILGMMSGAVFGAGTITLLGRVGTTGSFTPSIDFGLTANSAPHTINFQIRANSGEGVGGTQAQLISATPGVTYAPANVVANNIIGPNMNNYGSLYDRNVNTGSALWAGWLQGDPATGDPPTKPLLTIGEDEEANPTYTLYPLPGGNLPTPLLGSAAAQTQGADHLFATVTLTIPAGAVYPVVITVDGKLFNGSSARIADVSLMSFTALPEPVSALLLLAGLPLLRRRR